MEELSWEESPLVRRGVGGECTRRFRAWGKFLGMGKEVTRRCRQAEAAERLPSVKTMCILLDLAQHPGGLPVEECEWTPLKELCDLLVAEQHVTNRFHGHVPGVS